MSNREPPTTPPNTPSTLASRGIQPRFGEVAQSCRKLLMNNLAEHLNGLFSQVDDTLFECAEKAENNQVQNLFFDSMREIRKLRPQIERSYHQTISRSFSDFFEGKLKPRARRLDPQAEVDAERMSLVQNEDYEESLQITNMVSRINARCAQALFALEQRLALLNNGQKLSEESNPFGPRVIAEAFRDALSPCPLELKIKVILYSLFDQHVMRGLDRLYGELNQRLIEAGVLPNLKHSIQRSAATPRHKKASSSAPKKHTPLGLTPAPVGADDLDGPPPSDPGALLSSLASLLGEYRKQDSQAPLLGGTRSISSFGPSDASSTYSAEDLLDALDRLQRLSTQDLSKRMRQPLQVEGLKSELQEQLDAHSLEPGQQKLAESEADIIDLVGMLFDFILDDTCLADCYKTTLSHLHTPYLKVALQDRDLFTHHQHPARRLLNALAQAGVLYGSTDDESGLLEKMQWVVERVINGFSGDLLLFEALLEEFDDFTATLKHKVDLRERRAVEAAKGRDRLLGARDKALKVVADSLKDRQPPRIIHNFLELTWTDVLVFTLLRHGEQSHEWRRACEVAEQLAWSGTLLDEAGRERLQSIRVALLDDLRRGLQQLGSYHEDGIRRLLQDLVACQHAVQAQQPQVAEKLHPHLQESSLGAMLGEDAALTTAAPVESELSACAQALIKELQHLEFGTWFEFGTGQQARSLKLSWFSPTTHNYMFVDHGGQRAAMKPLTQLASEIEQGQARILPADHDAPLVDRALSAIYRVLQRFTGHTREPAKQ